VCLLRPFFLPPLPLFLAPPCPQQCKSLPQLSVTLFRLYVELRALPHIAIAPPSPPPTVLTTPSPPHGLPFQLNSALETASGRNDVAKCFVIGGGQIYKEALELPECDKIYRTLVHGNFDCDTFFPSIPAACELTSLQRGVSVPASTVLLQPGP
jgi:hypothetical protein